MKDYCVSCDKLKEGECDNDPETGTGWFHCNDCWEMQQKSLAYEDEQEYNSFKDLHPEAQAEIRSEYALAHVDFPY